MLAFDTMLAVPLYVFKPLVYVSPCTCFVPERIAGSSGWWDLVRSLQHSLDQWTSDRHVEGAELEAGGFGAMEERMAGEESGAQGEWLAGAVTEQTEWPILAGAKAEEVTLARALTGD